MFSARPRPGLLLGMTVAALLTGCGSTEPTADTTAPESMPDPGFGHVHGLGVNPADGVLYAATHYGVWRVPTDARPVRIADRFQDTMGFTVAGPDHFLGSGHPDPREDLPSHLGLIESQDRAETWKPLSLQGEADFHALEAKHGRIYGYDSTSSTFMISSDGRTWQHLAQAGLIDFTVSPSQPGVVLGTTEQGLVRSDDSGGSFTPLAAAPRLAFIDWSQGGLYGVDATGVVWTSQDGGTRWERRADAGSQPGALIVTEDSQIIAATEDGIVASTDAARTFTTLVS